MKEGTPSCYSPANQYQTFVAELKSLQIQVELLYLLVKQAVQLVAKNMKLQGKCG